MEVLSLDTHKRLCYLNTHITSALFVISPYRSLMNARMRAARVVER